MNDSNFFEKTYERVEDQRAIKLPPAWIATRIDDEPVGELGRDVHISGQERRVAERLIELLDGARNKVLVLSFLLADKAIEQAMLAAARRGVRVYVLLASETRLGREDSDGEFDQRVLAQHKRMLTDLAGHVLIRSAPHFHAKMVLVDPDDNPAGVLLTANLTKEALERNEELAVELTPAEVREATALVAWAMWETAEHEMVDPGDRFRAVKPLGSLSPPEPGETLLATTVERTELRRQSLAIINGAQQRLMVASFGWDEDHELAQRLCARARDGVAVTILARVRPASMPALLALREAGATVIGFKWLHAKAIWSDANEALVMSANLQKHGLDQGFELGVRLAGERASELHRRLADWSTRGAWRLEHKPLLGEITGKAKLWRQRKFDDIEVEESERVPLGEQFAASADELSAPVPALPPNGALPRMAHELRCTWQVVAPRLRAGSKEVFKTPRDDGGSNKTGRKKGRDAAVVSYSPPVFKEHGGRLVVAVDSPRQLSDARSLRDALGAAAIVVHNGAGR